MARNIRPSINILLLILLHSCLSHLTRYDLILLSLRPSSIHETSSCLRLNLFYFYSKFSLYLLYLLSYVLQLIVLGLKFLLFSYELWYHFTMNFSILILSQPIFRKNSNGRSWFFLLIQILKPIHVFSIILIFLSKFKFFHFLFN